MNPTGVIQGGWEFVVAAYGITAAILSAYAVSVVLRWRRQARRSERDTARGDA